MLRLTERLYLTPDGTQVVPHGHPEAATLLGTAGTLISEADAKRLKVKATEAVEDMPVGGFVRSQVAAVPGNPDDDSLYDDQSERGKKAREDARAANRGGVAAYVLSTGGTEEEAEQAALEATGAASPQGPSLDDQQRANAALRDEAKPKGK